VDVRDLLAEALPDDALPLAPVEPVLRRGRRARRVHLVAMASLAVLLLISSVVGFLRLNDGLPPGQRPGTPSPSVDAAGVWAQFVACARAHGQPSFPDVGVNPDGTPSSPVYDLPEFDAVRASCGGLLQQLPPEVRPRFPSPLGR
jgi:hypothetical protein